MVRDRIEFIETEREELKLINYDLFKLREDKKYLWVQRVCFWILGKIGCHEISTKVSCKRHVINTRDFLENLCEQKHGILEHYDTRGERVLVGNDEYMEITGNPDIQRMIHFKSGYNRGMEIMEMDITVVPWMKGILVIPKIE